MKNIKLAYATVLWFPFSDKDLGKVFKEIKLAGYQGVDLILPFPIGDTEREFKPLLKEIKKSLQASELELCSILVGNLGPEMKLGQITIYENGIDFALALGCDKVMFASGGREEKNIRTHIRMLARVLEELGEYAASRKIELTLHHHLGSLLGTKEEIDFLFEECKCENVKLTLDTGHLLAAGDDPLEAIKDYYQRGLLDYLHFKDARGKIYKDLGLGDGTVDFLEIMRTLKQVGYKGWIGVETEGSPGGRTPFQTAKKDREYLQEVLNKLQVENS